MDDPSRYPYSAVAALFAYNETDRARSLARSAAVAPVLTCTAVLVSPRHALTAASCVSRPTYELTWRAGSPRGGGSPSAWSDLEVVPGLYGDCSRAGPARVSRVRLAPAWAEWDASFGAADGGARAREGSTVDFNWALLTLEGAPGEAAGWFGVGPGAGKEMPSPGTNLSRMAYGGPSIETNVPMFSLCPLVDAVRSVDAHAPPALITGCAMYGGTRGAPLWVAPRDGGPRSVIGIQSSSLDYWCEMRGREGGGMGSSVWGGVGRGREGGRGLV